MSEVLYLVTGATGFVGSFVVDEVLANGGRVRALVRRSAQAEALEARGIEVVTGDLRDEDVLRKAVAGVKGIYHIAAMFREANQPDRAYYEVNADVPRRLLQAAAQAGVERVVHCSTVGVLGDVKEVPANEETSFNPGDVYQRSKLEGEKAVLEIFRSGTISGCVIRPAMIYGPSDTRNLKMFRMVARGRFFYVGRGEGLVHFIDVRDLARAFRLAMENTAQNGEVFIIAGQRYMKLREMAEMIARETGVRPPWLCVPVKPMQWLGSCCEAICRPLRIQPPIYRRRVDFFTKNRAFDSSKAQRLLGFEPAQSPEQEVADIVADYRARKWI